MWLLGVCFSAFIAAWVYLDARDRGLTTRAALAWAIGNFILPVFLLLLYVYVQYAKVPYERRPSEQIKSNTAVVLVCIFGVFIVNEMIQPMGGRLAAAYPVFLGLLMVNLPFLLAGVLVSTIIRHGISDGAVGRNLRGGPLVLVWSVLGGLILPLGQCGAAPIARRLMLKGASSLCGLMTVGMFPVFNSVLLVGLARGMREQMSAFVAVLACTVFAAIVTAAAVQLSMKKETAAETGGFDEEDLSGASGFCHNAVAEFIEYAKYLAIGAFLASLVAVFVPNEALVAWTKNASTETASAMLKGVLSPVTYLSLPRMAELMETVYGKWGPMSVFVVASASFGVTHMAVVYGALKARAAGLYLALMAVCLFLSGTLVTILSTTGTK